MFFNKKYIDEIKKLKNQNEELQKKLELCNAKIGGLTAANNRYRKDNKELSKINLLLQAEVNEAKPLKDENEKLNKRVIDVQNEKIKINSALTHKTKELSDTKKQLDLIKDENQSNKEKVIKLQGIVDNLNRLVNTKMRDKVTMKELKEYSEGGKKNN